MKRLNEQQQADKIVDITMKRIYAHSFSPMTSNEMKDKLCAFDLSIEYCYNIIDSLKWFQFDSMLYWRDVQRIIMKEKILFVERNSNLI
jgi:hypothetical protein